MVQRRIQHFLQSSNDCLRNFIDLIDEQKLKRQIYRHYKNIHIQNRRGRVFKNFKQAKTIRRSEALMIYLLNYYIICLYENII